MFIALLLLFLATWVAFQWGSILNRLLELITSEKHLQSSPEKTIFYGLALLAWLTAMVHFFLPIDKRLQSGVLVIAIGQFALFPEQWNVFKKWLLNWQTLVLIFIGAIALIGRSGFGDIADYHLQAVKWAEKFPTILGLGNFNRPLSNNNWWFNLQALFGFGIGNALSLYCLNTLMAIVSLKWVLSNLFNTKNLEKGIWAGLGLFAVFSFKTAFAGSISPDFPISLLVMICTLEFLQLVQNQFSKTGLIQLGILICFAISIKLNAIPLFVLLLAALFFKFNTKILGLLTLIGFVYVLPWFSGNVMVSGWLAYPISQVDIFNVDWKVPASVLDFERFSILQWGKIPGAPIAETAQLRLGEWLPKWFLQHDRINQGVMFMVCLSVLMLLIQPSTYKQPTKWIVFLFGLVGLLFCLSNGPHIRYAFGYFWLLIGLAIGSSYKLLFPKQMAYFILSLALILSVFKSSSHQFGSHAWFKPDAYPKVPLTQLQMGQESPLVTSQNSACWDQFPCSYYMVPGCELRGNTYESGFKANPEKFKSLFNEKVALP